MGDPVDQARDQRNQGGEEPQPPPQRTRVALHQLVAAEPAVTVEGARDSSTVPALMKLQAAMCAARLVGVVEYHRRLVAARTEARGDKG